MRPNGASPKKGAMWAIFIASALLYAILASPPLEFSPPFGKTGTDISAGEFGKLAGPRLETDDAGAIWLADPRNGSRTLIPLAGAPFCSDGRMFILRPDQKGASEIGPDGQLIWSREFGSLVTSFALSERESLWGLLDGSIVLAGAKGEILYRGPLPEGKTPSKHQCVYGVGISPDGGTIAAISGLEPQYLAVCGRQADSLVLDHSRILGNPARSAQAMRFSSDGTWLVAGTGDGAIAYSRSTKESAFLDQPASGFSMAIEGLYSLGGDRIAVMISPDDPSEAGRKFLCVYGRGAFEGTLPLAGTAAEILVRGNALYIEDDAGARRYEVTVK